MLWNESATKVKGFGIPLPITIPLYHIFKKNQEAIFVEYCQYKHCKFVYYIQNKVIL